MRAKLLGASLLFLSTLSNLGAVPAPDSGGPYTVDILLSMRDGAPSPQDVVSYFDDPQGPPPLQAFNVALPTQVQFLQRERPEGDYQEWLTKHPNSPDAILSRYIVAEFSNNEEMNRAITALQADDLVETALETWSFSPQSVELDTFDIDIEQGEGQYGRKDMNVGAAWQLAGGYSLVTAVDTGLYTAHAAFQQFNASGQYVGGNWISSLSKDIGGTGLSMPDSSDPDELRPIHITDPVCNPKGAALQSPIYAGHGTHVSGLVAANYQSHGVQGICAHCGIVMQKTTYPFCNDNTGQVLPHDNGDAQARGVSEAGKYGAQVVNMSFGGHSGNYNPCQQQPSAPICQAIALSSNRDIVMVASAGNNRVEIYFPARDPRVVDAGGFQQNLLIWDLSPNCPPGFSGTECGSNYTNTANEVRQEVMGSAQSVLSTTYPQYNWSPGLKCGDQFPNDPAWGNGVGWCTGTSMSAPQIAGAFGLLRSINPLVPTGARPATPAASLRYVMASTTAEAQAGNPWDAHMGYGHPDLAMAARTMLGKIAGSYVKNRATPLFRLYSSGNSDYAETTSPQLAVALMINVKASWQPVATDPTVANYGQFPHDPTVDGTLAQPRAPIYVLTTEFKPRGEWPALLPLYLMDKDYSTGKDFMLATSPAELQQAHTSGYNLRNIQGYIYAPCTPEPACVPPGAQKLWREYKSSINDCAVFLESERLTFENAGYTAACPAGSIKAIGYAYGAADSDSDGLPDGFEYVVGTNPAMSDSDGDGLPDGVEFPLVSIEVSDPCAGGTGALHCGADSIFGNGFDPL